MILLKPFQFILRIQRALFRRVWSFIYRSIINIPYFHFIKNTANTQMPCTLNIWFMQKVLGFNKDVYWPVHFSSKINQYKH